MGWFNKPDPFSSTPILTQNLLSFLTNCLIIFLRYENMGLKMSDLDKLSLETFEALLNQFFKVEFDNGKQIELMLSEVKKQGSSSSGDKQSFSLLFKGPKEMVLQQQIYPLQNDNLDLLSIFLVPVGSEDDHILYEAIFN